jgi:hypothetical protein
MSTSAVPRPRQATQSATRSENLLAALLAVASTAAAIGTLLPDLLQGPAAMNGSAKGTALVVLVVAVPLLVVSVVRSGHGSLRFRAAWIGTVAYLAYNAVLFCFATPFNRVFLPYVAMLGLAGWSLGMLVARSWDIRVDGARVPARGIAVFLWVVVVLNTGAWLAQILPGVVGALPPDFLDGTGMDTNPIFVQDLAFWLPTMAWLGWSLWQRRDRGYLLASAGLVYWLLEAVGVAVDQWWGHRLDPGSDVVSLAGSVGFAVMAVVTAVPLVLSFRWRETDEEGLA